MGLAQSLRGMLETRRQTERMRRFCIFIIIWISCTPRAWRHRNWLPSCKAALNHSAARSELGHFRIGAGLHLILWRERQKTTTHGRCRRRRLLLVTLWCVSVIFFLWTKKNEGRQGGEPDRDTNQNDSSQSHICSGVSVSMEGGERASNQFSAKPQIMWTQLSSTPGRFWPGLFGFGYKPKQSWRRRSGTHPTGVKLAHCFFVLKI